MQDRFVLTKGEYPLASAHWICEDERWALPEADVCIEVCDSLHLRKGLFSTSTFFYASCRDLFVASSSWLEVVNMLRSYGIPVSVDPCYVWQYLQSQCPLTNKTFCSGIYTLRSGEEVDQNFNSEPKAVLNEYVPEKLSGLWSTPDLRELLAASLQGVAFERTAFHLSAGLDSSILVILARESNPGSSIRSFTCKTLGRGAGDELRNVQKLACDYHLDLNVYDFSEVDVLLVGKRLIDAINYPIAHPSHLTRFLLDEAIAAENIDCIVTGRGADESLAGYQWHLPKYADPNMHKNRVSATARELLCLIFKENRESASFRKWLKDDPIGLGDRLQYDWWTIFESWNLIERRLEVFLNLKYLNPFLNRNLIKELFTIPKSNLVSKNILKNYLREYFRDTYPSYILEHPKHGLTIDINAYLMNYSSQEIIDAIFIDSQFAQEHLCRKEIEKLVNKTLTKTEKYGWQIWSLYLCSLASQKWGSGIL